MSVFLWITGRLAKTKKRIGILYYTIRKQTYIVKLFPPPPPKAFMSFNYAYNIFVLKSVS